MDQITQGALVTAVEVVWTALCLQRDSNRVRETGSLRGNLKIEINFKWQQTDILFYSTIFPKQNINTEFY